MIFFTAGNRRKIRILLPTLRCSYTKSEGFDEVNNIEMSGCAKREHP